MVTGQQLSLFAKNAIRLLKRRRRDQAAFFVAALCFSVGFALTRKPVPDFNTDKWFAISQIALYATGAIAFLYGVWRVWRLVNPLELPPAKDRPSAIKGPMAFTEADGELFRKLGRESELQKLLGFVLDNQILMVVVRGASGAGKTSLLRAGLKHILADSAVFHYWEAVPVEPEKGLLRAVQEKWPDGVVKPDMLNELVNPSDALGKQLHVIVLDQFEQLRGSWEIFQLLRRIVRESKPPHRITWVIAFRREFSDAWLDFISPEQENGIRPPKDVSLRLLSAAQAREVIGQLINESDLRDSIEQSVIDNLVEAATVDGEVSSVDIGIGLLVLAELHERQSGQTITNRDYQFAGGAEGLLTQYISRCLEPFPKESQESILKAMLALRDPEENRQRLASGLTIDELAAEAGTDVRALKRQLNRLAERDVRLLEAETPADGSEVRYRLPHERLISALYRLTGKLLAEVDQAKLKFQNAFQAWQTNDKRSRYLLKGKQLRLVQRYEMQIPWGQDEQEKKRFLFQSKRRRQFVWAATGAIVFILSGIGWFSTQQYKRLENTRYLTDTGYPAELNDFQHQLKKLEITEPLNLERFTWLSSNSLEELSLTAASSSNSIAGLASLSHCRSLKKLTLYLGDSQVSDLQPLGQLQGLTQLEIHFSGRSLVRDLQPLVQLKTLKQLSLYLAGSQVSDLRPLEQLNAVTQLLLYLGGSQVSDLQPLMQLRALTQLTLYLGGSLVTDLRPLVELKALSQLMLYLGRSQVTDLQPLEQLKALTQLTLDLNNNQMRGLQALEQLRALTQLTLLFSVGEVRNLQQIQQLKGLTQLALHLGLSEVRDLQPLVQLTGLQQLTLDLRSSQVRDLQPIEQLRGLRHLTLSLSDSQMRDLKIPEQLAKLTQLTKLKLFLTASQVRDLQPIEQLREPSELPQLTLYLSDSQARDLQQIEQLKRVTQLPQLTLSLIGSQVSNLQPLQQLKALQRLALDLRNSQVIDLQPLEQLTGLQQLTLDLRNSQVRDLQPIEQLTGLQQLSVDLGDSQVINLESIQKLTSLQTLSIQHLTRAQRMSLRNPPASLVELRF